MKADILKKSILQWAIEGKLVPQLESEPGVEQIGEAPENVPFAIPEKWKWVAIGSVCAYIQRGKSPKYSEIQQIPVVAQKCNQWDGFHIEKAKFIAPETAASYKTDRWLQDKDVLWNSTGLGTLGRVALYKKQLNPYGCAVADSHVTVMRCSSSLLPEYLYYYICSPSVQSVVEEISDGSTKQKELATKTIREFQFPLPPIDEQRRIIAKLNELLPLVETYGKEQEALEKVEKEFPDKLRASLLQEAIRGKLVPQLESEPEVTQIGEAPEDVPFAIPEKWRWVRVSDVAHTNPKVTAQTSSTEVSFIPMAALSAGYISQIALDAKRSWGTVKNGYTKFIEGDVLLAKITPCFQNRKSAIAKKLSNGIGCGSSEFHVLRVNENIVTQEYLLMFLKSQWFITYGVENFKGTAGQQRLGTSDLKNCLFPLPPMSEQHRIVAKLNELLDSVKHLEYNVSKT